MAFLVLAFGISWSLWIPVGILGIDPSSGVAQAALIAGSFGPAVAAILVRGWITREGFADAGLRPRLRRAWTHYAVAWLWPLPLFAALLLLVVSMGQTFPDLSLGQGSLAAAYGGLLLGGLLWTPLFFGEEFGWRSYLQIRLFAERPLWAAIATGLVWGAWHVPAALVGLLANNHGWLSLALLPWYTIWFSFLLGWLRARTQSVWAACLAHSANNMILAPLGALLGWTGGMGDILLSPGGLVVLLPIGVLVACLVLSERKEAFRPAGSRASVQVKVQVDPEDGGV